MGPQAGANGGRIIAEGSINDIEKNKNSLIGPFLSDKKETKLRKRPSSKEMFAGGSICLSTGPIHTVKPLNVNIPKGRLTVVTGVSGSGKTTLVLESLVPALEAATGGKKLPKHIVSVEADGIEQVKLIDATPIGINVRSTVATYANVHDELRKIFAKTDDAKRFGYKAGDFSYNTGKLRCPVCDGTGSINPRRTVSSRRRNSVSQMPRFQICPTSQRRKIHCKKQKSLFPPRTDGHGYKFGSESL